MTTFQQWVDAFRSPNLTVTGVTRYYDSPPDSLATADLPAAYPWLVGYDDGDFAYSCNDLTERFTITYEVVTEATAQSRMEENYAQVITMLDSVRTALRAMTIKNFMSFSMSIITRPVGNVNYWAVRAEVTGGDTL